MGVYAFGAGGLNGGCYLVGILIPELTVLTGMRVERRYCDASPWAYAADGVVRQTRDLENPLLLYAPDCLGHGDMR